MKRFNSSGMPIELSPEAEALALHLVEECTKRNAYPVDFAQAVEWTQATPEEHVDLVYLLHYQLFWFSPKAKSYRPRKGGWCLGFVQKAAVPKTAPSYDAPLSDAPASNRKLSIKDRIKGTQWTLQGLAQAVGVSYSTIWLWGKGARVPRSKKNERLCYLLNCTEEELFDVEALPEKPDHWRKRPGYRGSPQNEQSEWNSASIYCYLTRANCTYCPMGKMGYTPDGEGDKKCTFPWQAKASLDKWGSPKNASPGAKRWARKLLETAALEEASMEKEKGA